MSIYPQRLPLEYLSLANQVILSLEHFKKGNEGPEDKKWMVQALEFIKTALKGELIEKYTLDDETMKTSLVSSGTLRAFFSLSRKSAQKATIADFQKSLIRYGCLILDLTKESDPHFDGLVKAMKLNKVPQQEICRAETIDELKEFFRMLRDLILEEAVQPMEKVSLP
jgi:hypothetical protein